MSFVRFSSKFCRTRSCSFSSACISVRSSAWYLHEVTTQTLGRTFHGVLTKSISMNAEWKGTKFRIHNIVTISTERLDSPVFALRERCGSSGHFAAVFDISLRSGVRSPLFFCYVPVTHGFFPPCFFVIQPGLFFALNVLPVAQHIVHTYLRLHRARKYLTKCLVSEKDIADTDGLTCSDLFKLLCKSCLFLHICIACSFSLMGGH